MRKHLELGLKLLCLVLVIVLGFDTVRAIKRNRPFAHVSIPALPVLASNTNAAPANGPLAAVAAPPLNGPTNHSAGTNQSGTNLIAGSAVTNGPAAPALATMTTNLPVRTNLAAGSNLPAHVAGPAGTNDSPAGSNSVASAAHRKRSHSGRSPMMGMGFMPGMGGPAAPLPDLPPLERARVDKIVSSELLGPVPHPLPMALLGIAGNTAFLRAASGETGLVKEGDHLGDLKLLRIGTNRVLVEQNGEKQELTIFDGIGGESLLTPSDKNPHETTSH